jgi:Neutral/alkaline non-lysosomal ceramidase, N-terminal
MKMHFFSQGAAVAALVLAAAGVLAQAGPLRAGAAKVDISPAPAMFPLKDMQTYASLHDPIYARALVLDNGNTKIALISADSIHFPFGDELIKAVTDELHIPAANVIMNATHDHNSPSGGGGFGPNAGKKNAYFDILKNGIAQAAREANANLQPARIGFGTGKAYINVNRDEKIGAGYHMGYNPEGASDKTVAVLLVTRPTGEPIAIYANYPVHSVVMFRNRTKDGMVQVTSDLGGWASNYVEDHFKGAVALWTMASAGDQNPLFQTDYNQDAPDVHEEGEAGYAILDVLSRRVGEEVVRVSRNIQNTTGKAELWAASTSVTCPGRKRAEPPTPGTPNGGYLAPAHVDMIPGDPVTIPLQLVMINDIALEAVSGEVFTEIGMHMKRASHFDRTFVVTMLPNGIGYIPNDKAYLMPSEKAITNRIAPGCAEPGMVDAFDKLEKSYLPVWQEAMK